MRDLHHFHGKFDSVLGMKMKLMDTFGALLPPTTDFQIGYFSGKQSTKYWIMCQEDLDSLNKLVEKRAGSVMLWCDGKSAPGLETNTSTSGTKRKKKADDPPPTKRQQIEDELESVVKDLQEKHGNKYTLP